jgi:MFS family permease
MAEEFTGGGGNPFDHNRPVRAPSSSTRAAVAALVLGAGVTWNISNVGPLAELEAASYGVSLAVVGLFTTALFIVHAAVQIPGGRACDRFGARRVGFLALAAITAGNLVCLLDAEPSLALLGRAIAGLGSGAGFVAGAEYMRHAHASPVLQGFYGGATMAGGGIAIAVVPQLDGLGWRAPYWSALAVALVTAAVLVLAPRDRREPGARRGVIVDRRLVRLGLVHAATFGLSVVTANWVVTLLERQGHPRGISAVLGGLVLTAGIVTRPIGGWIVRSHRERMWLAVGLSLLALAASTAALALPLPLALLGLAAAVAGLSAGFPFAAVFTEAQRIRPDAPAAAIGFVNTFPASTIVLGTPLLGLTFSLPGDGRLGFALVAGLMALALVAVRRS